MTTATIIAHAGSYKVTKEHACSILAPEKTESWNPISHQTFISLVEDTMQHHGWKIAKSEFALNHEDHQMFGVYNLEAENKSDHTLALGIRNSTDKSLPAGLACGSRVFVCDNLAFSAELVMTRRHGINIMDHLPSLVDAAIKRFKYAADDQTKEFGWWKSLAIDVPRATDLICKAVERKVIAPRAIMDVRGEFINPRFPEFQEQNAWNLFNAFTTYQRHIRNDVAPSIMQADLMKTTEFMREVFPVN
jgi:hypothetical protein